MSVLTLGCNCASRGLPEEYRHGPVCPYGIALRRSAEYIVSQRDDAIADNVKMRGEMSELHAKLEALEIEHACLRIQLSEHDDA